MKGKGEGGVTWTLTCDVWSVCEECDVILVLLITKKTNSMPSLKKIWYLIDLYIYVYKSRQDIYTRL